MKWQDVSNFWFVETKEEQWFKKDPDFDHLIKSKFTTTLEKAARGELFMWRQNLEGRLAEIIVLDQFSRNIYRDSAKAFAQDMMALTLAQEAVKDPALKHLDTKKRGFLYMPYMHSESLLIHEEAMKLYSEPGLEQNLEFEILHKKIIERFGRYPHRNKILGRTSSPDEIAFLQEPNSSF